MILPPTIIHTADGSPTLYSTQFDAHYHSVYGAWQESSHIYVNLGFNHAQILHRNHTLFIFEMGFGTGFNALLTWIEAEKIKQAIHYVAVEAYPISSELAGNIEQQLPSFKNEFHTLHEATWNTPVALTPYFILEKHRTDLQTFDTCYQFDAIYYDAFAPAIQPELWTEDIFRKITYWMKPNANLTTYCSKVVVQRAMKAAARTVEKHPGPPHKREVLRAMFST